MREISIPVLVDRPDLANVADVLAERVRLVPDHPAFGRLTERGLVDVTTAQYDADVTGVARGLVAHGIAPGERVAIMAPTRYEWGVVDLGVWVAGGVVVPIYETSSVKQVAAILADAQVKLVVVGSESHAGVLRKAGWVADVWTMDAGPHDLDALAASGVGVEDAELERRRHLAGPDDLATIVYSSGTTGVQRGVRITHGNLVRLVLNVAADYAELIHDRAVTVVALPLAHILARGLQIVALAAGMKAVHVSVPAQVVGALATVRPTFMVVVPRLLQKIRHAARTNANAKRLGGVFRSAEGVAVAWGEHLEALQSDPSRVPSRRLRLSYALYDKLFFSRLRALMGGRVEFLLSGAAPLDRELGLFFWGTGIPVLEGYGLTETTAPLAGNHPGDIRMGSVGRPIPGTTLRISDDGEVLARGVGVSPGYLDPTHDADAFVDGWFRTGDLGSLDADGRLTLSGRSKNLIVTASGKNVAPEPWEETAGASALVAQAVVGGEGQPYLGAILLLDAVETAAWARRRNRPELAASVEAAAAQATAGGVRIDDEALRARVQRVVDRANAGVSRAEQVRRFEMVVADVTDAAGTFTPTLKLRREAFLAAASAHVGALYSDRKASS